MILNGRTRLREFDDDNGFEKVGSCSLSCRNGRWLWYSISGGLRYPHTTTSHCMPECMMSETKRDASLKSMFARYGCQCHFATKFILNMIKRPCPDNDPQVVAQGWIQRGVITHLLLSPVVPGCCLRIFLSCTWSTITALHISSRFSLLHWFPLKNFRSSK